MCFKYLKKGMLMTMPGLFKPTKARLIITQNCILKCQMCSFWKSKSPEPSLMLIRHWIDECAKFGIHDVSLGGGEPFIRKDLNEIVDYIHDKGMTCGITTSGYVNNKTNADRYEVSIDGCHPETHNHIRGVKGSWNKAFEFVNNNKYKVVQLNFALQRDNYLEIATFCELTNAMGLKVSIIPISLHLAAQPGLSSELGIMDLDLLKIELNDAYQYGNIVTNRTMLNILLDKMYNGCNTQRCLTPHTDVLIFADGNVYPCGNIDTSMGVLDFSTSLEDLYNNSKKLRSDIVKGKHPYCNTMCVYPDIVHRDLKTNLNMLVSK